MSVRNHAACRIQTHISNRGVCADEASIGKCVLVRQCDMELVRHGIDNAFGAPARTAPFGRFRQRPRVEPAERMEETMPPFPRGAEHDYPDRVGTLESDETPGLFTCWRAALADRLANARPALAQEMGDTP
jgi:hypothetical protein